MMKINFHRKVIIFYIVAISLLMAFPQAKFGLFQDSYIYYSQSTDLWNIGYLLGIQDIFSQTHKIEILFPLILYIEQYFLHFFGFISIDNTNKFYFILVNVGIVNFLSLYLILKLNIKIKYKSLMVLYFIIFLSSYYIYNNNVYVWRSIYAILFLYFSILAENKKIKIFYMIIGILFHNSIIIFYILYFLSSLIIKISKNRGLFLIIVFIIGMVTIGLYKVILTYFIGYFTVSTLSFSNLDMSLSYIAIKRIVVNLYFIILLLMIPKSQYSKYRYIYFFCLFLSIISMMSFFNWQSSSRIFIPAELMGSILLLFVNRNVFIKILFSLSCLPGILFYYSLLTHNFIPS